MKRNPDKTEHSATTVAGGKLPVGYFTSAPEWNRSPDLKLKTRGLITGPHCLKELAVRPKMAQSFLSISFGGSSKVNRGEWL